MAKEKKTLDKGHLKEVEFTFFWKENSAIETHIHAVVFTIKTKLMKKYVLTLKSINIPLSRVNILTWVSIYTSTLTLIQFIWDILKYAEK